MLGAFTDGFDGTKYVFSADLVGYFRYDVTLSQRALYSVGTASSTVAGSQRIPPRTMAWICRV
jgi:hypothetical protein